MRNSIGPEPVPHVPILVAAALLMAVAVPVSAAIDVDLAEAMFHQDRSFVSVACRGLSVIGCTVLTDLRITCRCSFGDGQWRIRWAIRGKVTQFVTTPQSLQHEAQHAKDLRARLEAFASQLENARFEKEAECQRAADRAIEVFPSAVHEVIRKDVLQVDRKDFEPPKIVHR